MTVSIMWAYAKPPKGKRAPGTSNDLAILNEIWPRGILCQEDAETLRGMHLAAVGDPVKRNEPTLWSTLADALEAAPDFDIEVWGDW